MDEQGTLWFTMQSGHVGRLIPQTEEMTISATPTCGTYPYGILVIPGACPGMSTLAATGSAASTR